MRRGLRACQAEWKLLCGTHNLLKLWRHTVTQPAATPSTAERSPGEVPEATAIRADLLIDHLLGTVVIPGVWSIAAQARPRSLVWLEHSVRKGTRSSLFAAQWNVWP
jgi:hypothetical protein